MKYRKKRKCFAEKKYFLEKLQFEVEWNVKKFFMFLGKSINTIFDVFIETIRMILIRALKIIMIITNILFIFSLLMLFKNIKELLSGVNFTNTKYFFPMVTIMGIHFVVVFFSNLLKEKN